MVSKLVGAIFLVTLVVAIVTAVYDKVDKPSRRLFERFLQRRSCKKECEWGCRYDSDCCLYKNTGRNGRCRSYSNWPHGYKYQCIHPDYRYVTTTEVINDDCGTFKGGK